MTEPSPSGATPPTGASQPEGPLAHLRVVDLTSALGTLACRFLWGLGATVTRIEPPGGDPLRAMPPLARSVHGVDVSLWWLHMMAGREMVTLDLTASHGRDEFRSLLAGADIVIESRRVGELAALGLDYENLRDSFPRLIWTSITPFGRDGPRANWAGSDLIGLAAGGLMSLCGDPDLPPVRPSVEQGYAQAGAAAVAGTLAAVHARNLTGHGQLVDVSMQEAIANCLGNARLFFEFEGIVSKRAGGARAYGETGSRLVYPCADGHVAISRTPDTMAPLHRWIRETAFEPHWDADEWATLPQSGPGTPGAGKARELESDLMAFFALSPKMALYEEGQRRGVMICPVSTPADLLANEQLIARGYFREQFVPELGRAMRLPGPPVRFSKTPWRDADAVMAGALVRTQAEVPHSPPLPHSGGKADSVGNGARNGAVSRQVLEGLRVADFSWVGVGPICTQLLAGLAADVIRVESTARLDVFRSGGPRRGSSRADASAYFANCNRDKRGMTLNLSRPGARDVALRLAARSDILVESFRPGFMASAGLSYDDIRAVNPGIIMMSCSMEGATGPHAAFKGFGLTLQATVGFTHFTGWPDRDPVGTGTAYTDWFGTNVAQAAILAAIEHRRRTREGQYIDLSQLEACIWALDAEVVRYTATGALRVPLGNRHEAMAPHGVFPCAGSDRWIAIAVAHDDEWLALVEAVGDPALDRPEFGSLTGRKANEDGIEAAISRWTARYEKHELAPRLQALGIPAHAVNDVGDVHGDAQLRARGHFLRVEHPTIGPADWDAPAFRLAGTPLIPLHAAPTLGQHNAEIYGETLGYSDSEIAEMAAGGIIE